MFDAESLKVLCGNSIEEPEVDYDDAEVASITGNPVQEEASREYDFTTITDNMNHPDFKPNYVEAMKQIKRFTTKKQQMFAMAIVQKMPEKYDFQFSLNFNPFYSQDDIDELYNFIEFYEYNHEKFITTTWKYLKPNIHPFQIKKFCKNNTTKILSEIEEQLETHDYSELIADFLRTYNKDKLIEWFCKKSKELRSSILITLLRKE